MRPFHEINRLERAEWLDRPAAAARALVEHVLRPRGLKDVLHGVWLGHPLHPGAAQFALGSFTSAALLDALGGPRSGSTRLIAAGLAASVPSLISGWRTTRRRTRTSSASASCTRRRAPRPSPSSRRR